MVERGQKVESKGSKWYRTLPPNVVHRLPFEEEARLLNCSGGRTTAATLATTSIDCSGFGWQTSSSLQAAGGIGRDDGSCMFQIGLCRADGRHSHERVYYKI